MEWGILPNTVALAAVALLGYLFGRSGLRRPQADPNQMRQEFQRARTVVNELERISLDLRRNLANHHGSVAQLQKRLTELQTTASDDATVQFCRDAEQLLAPTRDLTRNMTSAYNALREQSGKLNAFADTRVCPLTGLSNRKALDDSLASLLALKRRYHNPFAVCLIEIDGYNALQNDRGEAATKAILKQIADLLQGNIRETDIAARFGGGEFVIVMPETDLESAAIVARRARRVIQQETDVTISSGLASALDGDTGATLLCRAEMARNEATVTGRDRIHQHSGGELSAVPSRKFFGVERTDAVLSSSDETGATISE